MSIRILLADDHEILLDGLSDLLGREPDFEVIGVARNGNEAVERALAERPDVVVMDISMPGLDGVAATGRITAQLPGVKVLGLSAHAEPRFVAAMLAANASGYLRKDCSREDLVRAIRHIQADGAFIGPRVGRSVVREGAPGAGRASVASTIEPLTEREREILQLIAAEHSTQEIADRLQVSSKTVGSHRAHLMEKLDIYSVAGLTKYAMREGLTNTLPA